MKVLEEMKQIRQGLIDKDRRQAMEILTEKLYYGVAPLVMPGDDFELFEDESAAMKFREENRLDNRAFQWLLDALRDEGLISPETKRVRLTQAGVMKLCFDK